MADILLITHWTGGDVYPFINLGKQLKKAGHKVTILTHCSYENKAVSGGLEFVPIDSPEEYDDMNRDLHMLSDPIEHRSEYLGFFKKYHGKERLLREYRLIEENVTADTIIVARFRSSISGVLAAEKLGLRYLPMILAPNYFSHIELHNQLFGSDFAADINGARLELGLCPIKDWKNWLYSPAITLCAWPSWYAEPDETWPEGTRMIGFIEKTDNIKMNENDESAEEFLQKAHQENGKTAIITGGSSSMVSSEFYRIAAEACVLADVSAVIVTPYKHYIPENLPGTIMWAHDVNLAFLMKKTDIIIHHGGMGTINEAIDAGIPQIIMPHLTDGPDNARRLEKLGIAARFPVKNWDSSMIGKSIISMLSGEKKDSCNKYRQLNTETYEKRLWLTEIENAPGYVFNEQKKDTNTINSEDNAVSHQFTREQFLQMIKRKNKS